MNKNQRSNGRKRKKKIVHIKDAKGTIHFGTRNASIRMTVPIRKLVAALGRRGSH